MRFEELARKAGKAAVEVGRRADRLPFARIVDTHKRQRVAAGWSVAAAAVVIVIGSVLLWPGTDGQVPPAAEGSTTTQASTPTSTSESTTTSRDDGMTSGVVEGGREACPVTGPGDHPFTPASETPEGPPPVYEAAWYGTPDLWTMVHHQGEVWTDLPVAADGSLTQKTFWWSNDYILSQELQPDISVTAEHLNGSAPTVTAGNPGTNGSHQTLGDFMIVGLDMPEEGCWRITAEYRDTTLSYVAWVGDDTTTTTRASQPLGTIDLLDGSQLEIGGASALQLTGYFFTIELPGGGTSRVDLSPDLDPADPRTVDPAAVLEAYLGNGVRLWRADREGQPFFMTVDLSGWVAVLHVGNQTAPDTGFLTSIADQLQGQTSGNGVVLSEYTPDPFTTYLEASDSDSQIHFGVNQCIRELVPGSEVIDHPSRGELIRGPEYASWCDEDANIEIMVYGDEEFIDDVVAAMTVIRTPPQDP